MRKQETNNERNVHHDIKHSLVVYTKWFKKMASIITESIYTMIQKNNIPLACCWTVGLDAICEILLWSSWIEIKVLGTTQLFPLSLSLSLSQRRWVWMRGGTDIGFSSFNGQIFKSFLNRWIFLKKSDGGAWLWAIICKF